MPYLRWLKFKPPQFRLNENLHIDAKTLITKSYQNGGSEVIFIKYVALLFSILYFILISSLKIIFKSNRIF
jgi:hypothetical protein